MQEDSCANQEILQKQQEHWEKIFSGNPSKFGEKASHPAVWAADTFKKEGKTKILELGAGQGRDTLFFAKEDFEVCALDYCKACLLYTSPSPRDS